MSRFAWFLVFCLAIACIVVPFIPTSYERIVRDGTDEYGAHHALYANRVKSVGYTIEAPIREVGLILVNLRRTEVIAPVTVHIVSDGSAPITMSRELPTSLDDEFVWFKVPPESITAGAHIDVRVSAPGATIEAPIGIRFSQGDKQLAFAVRERIPLWQQGVRWVQENPRRASMATTVIGGAVVLAAGLLGLEYLPKRYQKTGVSVAFVCLVALVLITRVPISNTLESAFGGDAFNYILKGNAWIVGEDPFAADFRKAPLYPFLVTPGLLPGLDPVLWARGISIIASGATVLFVVLILLRIGVSLPIAALSGVLLAVNRDYQFESVQGISNTVYGFFIVAAVYAFICKKAYMVSVVSALAAITRFEGVLVAAVLAPASWIIHRVRVSSFVRSLIPLVVIGGLPLILYPFTGELGIRSVEDLRSDEGLYIGYTWDYLAPSIKALKLIFGRLWILTEHVGNPFASFGIGVCIGVVGVFFFRRYARPRVALAVIPALVCVAMFAGILLEFENQQKFFIVLFSLFSGAGVGGAIVLWPKITIPIAGMVLLQVALVTAILPKNRYYLQCIPFIAMSIGVAFWLMAGTGKYRKIPHVASVFCMSMVVLFVYADARNALSGQISDYNEKSSGQTVLMRAGLEAKRLSAVVGAASSSDLIMRAYVPVDRLVFFSDALRDTDGQMRLIREKNVEYIVERTEDPYFATLISQNPELFEQQSLFTTKWGSDIAKLYRVVY